MLHQGEHHDQHRDQRRPGGDGQGAELRRPPPAPLDHLDAAAEQAGVGLVDVIEGGVDAGAQGVVVADHDGPSLSSCPRSRSTAR